MSQQCPHCQAPQQGNSRFCSTCGQMLGAQDQGQTMVIQPTQPGTPAVDVQAIGRRAEQTFGKGPMQMPTTIAPSLCVNQREHTGFVIDVSGSMKSPYDSRFTKVEAAIRANGTMVVEKEQIDPMDEIAIVSFNHEASTLLTFCPIKTHKRQMLTTLQSLRPGGGTDIEKGMVQMERLFDFSRNDVVRRLTLLTDGHGGHPLRVAERLKEQGVVIDVIGVGANPSGVDEKLLKQVASTIQGELRYRFIKDQQTLVAHYTQLANKTATA